MSLEPGQSHKGDAQMTETRTAAEALSPGDAVALDSNDELVAADGTDNPVVYGVVGYNRGEDYEPDDDAKVTYSGPVVANVASGTAGGVEVGASATDGELAAGSSPRGILTMYAEGASPGGVSDIDDGYGHVHLP